MNQVKGDKITFSGFTEEDIPDNGELLVEGEEYTIESINEETAENDASVNLSIPNPNFDSKKRASKKNVKTVIVNLFPDEYSTEPAVTGSADVDEDEDEGILEYDDVNKGDIITVVDTDGESLTGEVFKKTKTMLGIVLEEDDGTEDEVVYKKNEVAKIFDTLPEEAPEETEPEEVPEEKPAPKKKTAAKKKAPVKKKAVAKKKAPVKKEETKEKAPAKKKAATTKSKSKVKPKSAVEETDEDLKDIPFILEEDEEDEEVLSLIEGADDLCDLAEELAEEAAVQDFRLGGILYHVRVSKAFREILDGLYDVKEGFKSYVEQELGVGYRKAMYLIKTYSKCSKFGVDTDKIVKMGWTKAQEISNVMTEDNAEQLVDIAGDSTVAELKETIKESFSKKGEDTRELVKKVTFKFRLTEEAGVSIEGYLDQAAEQLGLKKMEDVFEHVVSEWAQEHLDISSTKRSSKKK